MARAISAAGLWKPKARRVIRRIWVLIASTRALERPCRIARLITNTATEMNQTLLLDDAGLDR
jgi:hypothetical protein